MVKRTVLITIVGKVRDFTRPNLKFDMSLEGSSGTNDRYMSPEKKKSKHD